MDPCSFVRVLVGNLALKIPVASRPDRSGVHPSSTPCYCKIMLHNLPYQTVSLPLLPPDESAAGAAAETGVASAFNLSSADLERISDKSIFAGKEKLMVAIYTGRRGTTCGINSGRLLGKVKIPLVFNKAAVGKAVVFHSGWVAVGKSNKGSSAQLHLTVKSEPDPRFVFEFGGEPACSPRVFQIQGNMRQPVFTCKFSCRNPATDRNVRCRSSPTETGSGKSWLKAFGSEKEKPGRERKGWSVTVHDLSGSPVAMASIVTPFVASPGTDRVSRSNPGAWLILGPSDGTWKPWGRLEAWRERGGGRDALGYRFELLPDATSMAPSAVGVSLAESAISTSKGGRFIIDLIAAPGSRGCSPAGSPRGSGDFGYGLWPFTAYRGFVMSSTVAGEGQPVSRPVVEVGVKHVGSTEDAAAFIALAAAIDLSVDACRLFSSKLRKDLQPQGSAGDGLFVSCSPLRFHLSSSVGSCTLQLPLALFGFISLLLLGLALFSFL